MTRSRTCQLYNFWIVLYSEILPSSRCHAGSSCLCHTQPLEEQEIGEAGGLGFPRKGISNF
jgi:hypothetical protein